MFKITNELIDKVLEEAAQNPRRRKHFNFHRSYNEKLQRLINTFYADTYIPPHNHSDSGKIEILILLKGRVCIAIFNDHGEIIDSIILSRDGEYGVELQPHEWHMIIAVEDKSVLFEVKEGPFEESKKKYFAPWSPEPGTPEAQEYLLSIKKKLNLI